MGAELYSFGPFLFVGVNEVSAYLSIEFVHNVWVCGGTDKFDNEFFGGVGDVGLMFGMWCFLSLFVGGGD